MKVVTILVVLAFGIVVSNASAKPSLEQARQKFEAVDAVLNKAYNSVCAGLDKEKVKDLRQKERDWLQYRDAMAEARPRFNTGVETNTPKLTVDYWEAMTDITGERVDFLRAYSGKNVPVGISGEYGDSFAGNLELEETKTGIVFSLVVVRGWSAHIGDITGVASLKGDKAFFKEKVDAGQNREPCELTFTFVQGHIVKVVGKNTDYYHGMGVSFDGVYYKTGKLKKPIKLDESF